MADNIRFGGWFGPARGLGLSLMGGAVLVPVVAFAQAPSAPEAAPVEETPSESVTDGAGSEGTPAEGGEAPVETTPSGESDAVAPEAGAAVVPPPTEDAGEPEDPFASEPELVEAAPEPEYTPPPRPPSPFDQGRLQVGVMLGWAQAQTGPFTSTNWVILGAGVGYYVLDGLAPHFDATFWLGDPFISTVTPGLRYVFHMVPAVKPYVGAFYRHYFVANNSYGWDDTDAIGARGGVYFMVGPMSYFGGGIVYEHFLDEDLYLSVDQVYPELSFAIAF